MKQIIYDNKHRENFNIYSKDIPEILTELLETPEVKKLNGIGQHCGTDYTGFPIFEHKYKVSRLDHSMGVALIVWNFTHDIKQAVAGLFHDIASPVFGHVVDFLKQDFENQEATEENTEKIISDSKEINKILKKYEIEIKEVSDYKIYPIADNKLPMLSADRLEYTMEYILTKEFASKERMNEVYSNLTVLKNEEGTEELGFKDVETAVYFAGLALKVGEIYLCDEDRFAMKFLADILNLAINEKVIRTEELYMDEKYVINKILSCDHDKLIKTWEVFRSTNKINRSDIPIENKYCIKVPTKKRWIDPLVIVNGKAMRTSKVSSEIENKIKAFLEKDFNRYLWIDYEW